MILIFLGIGARRSHRDLDPALRSSAVAMLWALGETLNIMTLAGRARGWDSRRRPTVTIENINGISNRARSRDSDPGRPAADRDAGFVSLLCICIVFVPMFFLTGVRASCSCRWPKP